MTFTIDPPAQRTRTRSAKGNGGVSIDPHDLRGQVPPLTTEEIAAARPAQKVVISPPRLLTAAIPIRFVSPYVQHAFSQKAQLQMEETQRAGTQARSRKNRAARDFEAGYLAAQHRSQEGWLGIPAPAFRNAMIDACRLVGFKMTHAKLTIFIHADGFDANDGTPLVRITKGEPEIHKGWGRNANGGADLRWRPMWRECEAVPRIRWDADQFSSADVLNLLARAGLQVGVGEGRPNSPNSNGLGWGLFEIVNALVEGSN
jgi:hypothetical protein